MMYHSPFSIFKSLGIEANEIKADQIKNLEKRLLLELELSGEISLQAGDTELTKNDILNLFSELAAEGNLEHHQQIAENPQLLQFLQSGEFDEQLPFYDSKLLYQKNIESFKAFISPYLSEVLKKEINLQFNKRNFRIAFKLLELTDLLTDSYKSLAFDKLAGSINQLVLIIGQFSREEIPLDKKNYAFLMHDHFISFINALPDEFNNAREKLAININNLGAHYQKKEVKFVYMIFMALKQLNCSEAMKKTIADNSYILSSNYRHTSEKETDKSSGYGCFSYIGLIVLVIILVRACGSNAFDSSPSRNYNYFDSDRYKELQRIIEKNSSIYSAKLDHLNFTSQIINFYSEKKGFNNKTDTISTVPLKPYYAYYMPFEKRTGNGDSILISNQSEFDMVVFSLSGKEKYAIGVPAKSSAKVVLVDKDQINLYIGKYWDDSNEFKGKQRDPKIKTELFNGAFLKKSPFTVNQLRTYHEYRNPEIKARENSSATHGSNDALVLEEVEITPDSKDEIMEEEIIVSQVKKSKKTPVISITSGNFADFALVVFSDEFTMK